MIQDRYISRPPSAMTLFIPDRAAHPLLRPLRSVSGTSAPRPPDDDPKAPRAIRLGRPDPVGVRRCSRPMADPEVMATRIYLSSGPPRGGDLIFQELPPLPPVALPAFCDAFHAKLKQCSIRCRWAHPSADLRAKEIKTNDLLEVLKICEIPSSLRGLSQASFCGLLDMIVSNVDRHVPPLAQTLQMSDELPTFHDPEWPHLMVVYDILRRAHGIAPQAPGFTNAFFKKVLNQIGSPDAREKDQICGWAADFAIARPRVMAESLGALASALLVWSDTANSVFAVNAVITIYLTIIRGVGHASSQTKAFFYSTILPQITSLSFIAFAKPFVSVVQAFLALHPQAVVSLVQRLTEYWPQTRSAKQVFFVKLTAIAIPHASQRCAGMIVGRLFPMLAECIASHVFRVAEVAMQILVEPAVDVFIKQNAEVLPLLIPAARRAAKTHWAPEIRELAQATVMMLSRIDCRMTREESSAQAECQPGQIWARIVQQVHRAGHEINLSCCLSLIMATFGAAKTDRNAMRRQSAAVVAPRLPK